MKTSVCGTLSVNFKQQPHMKEFWLDIERNIEQKVPPKPIRKKVGQVSQGVTRKLGLVCTETDQGGCVCVPRKHSLVGCSPGFLGRAIQRCMVFGWMSPSIKRSGIWRWWCTATPSNEGFLARSMITALQVRRLLPKQPELVQLLRSRILSWRQSARRSTVGNEPAMGQRFSVLCLDGML